MPPRNPELPEGTDQIINGAMETNGGDLDDIGGGGASTGFVGSGAGDDTGGMSTGTGGGNMGGGTGSSGLGGSGGGDFGGGGIGGGSGSTGGGMSGGNIKAQLRDGASNLQSKAGEQIRAYAETGKTRATTALDDLTQVVNDAAGAIDERLGSEYGEYARRAADTVAGFADTLRNKDVDELFEDGRNLVRKSPGVAIGVAAVVGFSLVRLLKAGFDNDGGGRGQREIEFEPDAQLGTTGTSAGTTTGTTTVGAGSGTTTGSSL